MTDWLSLSLSTCVHIHEHLVADWPAALVGRQLALRRRGQSRLRPAFAAMLVVPRWVYARVLTTHLEMVVSLPVSFCQLVLLTHALDRGKRGGSHQTRYHTCSCIWVAGCDAALSCIVTVDSSSACALAPGMMTMTMMMMVLLLSL